jgi:chromosome segregation ATPase
MKNAKATFDFPDPSNISPHRMKEYYSKLLGLYSKELSQKEELMKALRKETLASEEQRNKINILRELIENNVPGIMEYLTYENLIDYQKLKAESNYFKNELVKANRVVEDCKKEIHILRNSTEEVYDSKTKLKFSLQSERKELDEARERLYNLDVLNNEMQIEINKLREINKALKHEIEISRKGIYNQKINEKNDKSAQQVNNNLLNRLQEYDRNYKELNQEFEKVVKERTKLELENETLHRDLRTLFDNSEMLKMVYEKDREDWKLESEQFYKLKALYDEISQELQETKKIIKTKCSRLNILQTQVNSYKSENEKILLENVEFKAELLKQDQEYRMICKEFKEDTSIIKETHSTLNTDINQMKEIITKLECQNNVKDIDISVLCEEINKLKRKTIKISICLEEYKQTNLDLTERYNELDIKYKLQSSSFDSERIKLNSLKDDIEVINHALCDKDEKIKSYINKLKECEETFDQAKEEQISKYKEIYNSYFIVKHQLEMIYAQLCYNIDKLVNKNIDNISKLQVKEARPSDEFILTSINDYIKIVTIELEFCFNKLKESEKETLELKNRNIEIDSSLKLLSEQAKHNEDKFNKSINEMNERIDTFNVNSINSKGEISVLKHELVLVTKERNDCIEESKEVRNEYFTIRKANYEIDKENHDLQCEVTKLNDTISKHQNTYQFVIVEKKNVESLFIK